MGSLYQLTDELETLLQREDVTDEDLARAFGDVQAKAESICQFRACLMADIVAFKAEEDRISKRRKAMENTRERLEKYLLDNMQRLMIDKLRAGTFAINLQESPARVIIDEESAIPDEYFIEIPASKRLDKDKAGEAMKNGQIVTGCHLERHKHIRIR